MKITLFRPFTPLMRTFWIALFMLISVASTPVTAQEVEKIENFSQSRLVIESAKFLGTTAESMAEIVGRLFAQYGPPSAVLRGEEVSAAIMLDCVMAGVKLKCKMVVGSRFIGADRQRA